jgi:putative FmdB family regulatory protein
MPVYTYRREDGTTFDYRQKFSDDPLARDPETGQRVRRVVQAAGVIFKGSGFYVTDNGKGASKPPVSNPASKSASTSSESGTAAATTTSSESKGEKTGAKEKVESTPAAAD